MGLVIGTHTHTEDLLNPRRLLLFFAYFLYNSTAADRPTRNAQVYDKRRHALHSLARARPLSIEYTFEFGVFFLVWPWIVFELDTELFKTFALLRFVWSWSR